MAFFQSKEFIDMLVMIIYICMSLACMGGFALLMGYADELLSKHYHDKVDEQVRKARMYAQQLREHGRR